MKRLLFVDDDADILEIITLLLSHRYQLECLCSSKNLTERITQFKPSVILIDNHIGNERAADVISGLRISGHGSVPFILFSGDSNIVQTSKLLGASGVVSKPFAIATLVNCIEQVCSSMSTLSEE